MCSNIYKTFRVWNTSSESWQQLKVSHNSFRCCPHVHRYFQNHGSVKPCCHVVISLSEQGDKPRTVFSVWRFLLTWNIVNVFGRPRNTHGKALYYVFYHNEGTEALSGRWEKIFSNDSFSKSGLNFLPVCLWVENWCLCQEKRKCVITLADVPPFWTRTTRFTRETCWSHLSLVTFLTHEPLIAPTPPLPLQPQQDLWIHRTAGRHSWRNRIQWMTDFFTCGQQKQVDTDSYLHIQRSSFHSLNGRSKQTHKYTSKNKVLRAETCPNDKSADLRSTFTWLSFLSLGSSPSISPGDSCLSRLSVSPGAAHITPAGRQKQSDPRQNQQPIITSHGPKHWRELSVMKKKKKKKKKTRTLKTSLNLCY